MEISSFKKTTQVVFKGLYWFVGIWDFTLDFLCLKVLDVYFHSQISYNRLTYL